MKWTLILLTVAFLASSVMAAIDDDPPRLVVWAGTVQFVLTVIAATIYAWWSRVTPSTPGEASLSREDARPQ
jgi:hypothetical protein